MFINNQQNVMIKSSKTNTVFWAMIILGLLMIGLGAFAGPQVMLPPIVTGVGFLVLAWGIK